MTSYRVISYYLLFVAAILLSLNKVFPHHHHHQETCCVADHDAESDHCCESQGHDHSECEDNHDASEFCQSLSFFLVTGKKENSLTESKFKERKTHFTDISSVRNHVPFIVNRYSHNHLFNQDPTCQDVKYLIRAMRGPPAS